MTALILTTAHWAGDPRLNRHVAYLEAAGIPTKLVAFGSAGIARRLAGVVRALREVRRERPNIVIFPDPELFVIGSIWARLIGVFSVIDIHEDYRKAAFAREWVPRWLRTAVGLLALLNDRIGRLIAAATVVAATELSTKRSATVLNIPDPGSFSVQIRDERRGRVVYIGDVTIARGALEIADLARRLPELTFLVIGRCATALADEMEAVAGPEARLELVGQKAHTEAWEMARGSTAGLCLLRPVPAYRDAVATKLWEYCASGIPPVVTDLPGQRELVSQIDPALVGSSIDEIAQILHELATRPSHLSVLRSKATEFAENAWSQHRPDLALISVVSRAR